MTGMNEYQQISSQAGAARIAGERQSQHLVTAFVISGLLFMLLPGTFLGVWNLLTISQEHGPATIPQAWLQAHGRHRILFADQNEGHEDLSGQSRMDSMVGLDVRRARAMARRSHRRCMAYRTAVVRVPATLRVRSVLSFGAQASP